MKSSFKTVSSIGAVALVLAGAAQAEPSRGSFDQWSVSNGNITADCSTGSFTSCGAALTDPGFLTRMVVDSSTGKQFFQTIVTMPDATATQTSLDSLEFSDENFVSFTNNNGIIDKQRLYQVQTLPIVQQGVTGTHDVIFQNGSVIGTGWASDFVELTQTISDPLTSGGDGFQIDFIYETVGYNDPGNSLAPHGMGMKLTNYIPIDINAGDRQDFVLVQKKGDFVTADGSVTLPGTNGGTLAWTGDTSPGDNLGTVGDDIQALWIGQNLSTAGQQFGYAGYTNFTTPDKITTFSLANTLGDATTGTPDASINWDTNEWGTLETQGTVSNPFPAVP